MEASEVDALRARRERILARMERALSKSGRSLDDAQLIAVSKTVEPPMVEAAIQAGYTRFAENRPQMLSAKLACLSQAKGLGPYTFDMIGNLQTNKINSVLGRVGLIHSVSSLHLARGISTRAKRRLESAQMGAPQGVLVEVNVLGEASKSGFSPNELRECFDEVAGLAGIELHGLMTMAPRGDIAAAHAAFSGLRELRDELAGRVPGVNLPELSCGMSGDFEAALEEGSTMVRLGRVVFDQQFTLE